MKAKAKIIIKANYLLFFTVTYGVFISSANALSASASCDSSEIRISISNTNSGSNLSLSIEQNGNTQNISETADGAGNIPEIVIPRLSSGSFSAVFSMAENMTNGASSSLSGTVSCPLAISSNFTLNTTEGNACLSAGGTLGTTNLYTDLDGGSFGTGSGAVDEIPATDPYAAQITDGTFVNNFSSFNHGDYTYISNHQVPRNSEQHGGGIYDPVNGVNGRFFISDPDSSAPMLSSSITGLSTGQSYELSFWVADSEIDLPDHNRIGIFANGVEVYNTGFVENPTTTTVEWKKFSFVYTHNDPSTTANFEIRALEAGKTGRDIFFDEVKLYTCNLNNAPASINYCGVELTDYLALDFNQTPSLESGSANSVGAVYRFSNIATNIDALVSVDTLKANETITLMDGELKGKLSDTSNASFSYTVSLVKTGTSTPIDDPIDVVLSSSDIDSNPGNTVQDFSFFKSPTFTVMDSPTNIDKNTSSDTHTFTLKNSHIGVNVAPEDTEYRASAIYLGVKEFEIGGGHINANKSTSRTIFFRSGIAKLQDYASLDCTQENPIPYDYGDAPASFGDVKHRKVYSNDIYLGNTSPDAEASQTSSPNAVGDDSNGTDDEEALSIIPDLYDGDSTYTLSASCSGNGFVTGWIDLDRSSDFNANERNTNHPVMCNSGIALLEWTSLPSLSVGNSFIRLRTASEQPQVNDPIGTADDGEIEDYALTISAPPSCNALSGNINADIAPALHLRSGDKIYLASNSTSDKEGHLKAFAFDSNGTPSTTVSWDAALQMDATERILKLFSTNASGNIVTLNTLDDAAFETNGIPDVATIQAYTLNPAHLSGLYLNGRRDGSFLGTVSPNSNLGLLDNTINVMAYLDDSHYRSHYENVISLRAAEANATKPKRVFLSSDDGFLYAFDQYDGDLGWGWMPRSLVKELKDFATFQSSHFMQGHIDILDLKNLSNNTYASYIIGSYRNGLGQYVLRLDTDGDLDTVIWDADYLTQSSVMNQAPNQGKRAYFSNNSGRVFSAFITTNINDESTLHIRSLVDDADNIAIPLNFKATSTPFVSINLAAATAPAAKTLYLGSDAADIYAVSLFADGVLKTGSQISQSISKVATLGNGSSSAINYLGISSAADTSTFYLRAQSEDQLTLFSYNATAGSWNKKWTTYVSGAGKWLTADATSITTDAEITPLPAGSIITNEARIVAGSIVLPVMHAPSGTACYGDAYYYFYQLDNGHFPERTFFSNNNNTPISEKLNLGIGISRTLHLTDLPGKQRLLGIGIADQTNANSTGVNQSFYIKDTISTGIRSWREIR